MMALLDNLSVWDVESDGGWKEMARLGLCLLIQYASQPDLEVKHLSHHLINRVHCVYTSSKEILQCDSFCMSLDSFVISENTQDLV